VAPFVSSARRSRALDAMSTVDYRRVAWKVTLVATVITIVAMLPLVNLNPHADLRALMVLDAPVFLIVDTTSTWPACASWTLGALVEFLWVWSWTFVVWLLIGRVNRTHGI
jgi:hypothetical protein